LVRRLDGTQNPSGCGGEERNCQPLPGLEPPVIKPVAAHKIKIRKHERNVLGD